jgi:hypothetical protein
MELTHVEEHSCKKSKKSFRQNQNYYFFNHSKGAATISTTTFSLTTLSIKGLFVTLSIGDTQHYVMLRVTFVKVIQSVAFFTVIGECRYAECH